MASIDDHAADGGRRRGHYRARWAHFARGRMRLALGVWLALLALCAIVAARTTFTADLSAFLPRAPSAEQQVLVDQLRDGLVSRLILVGIEGGTGADGARRRAGISKAMAALLRNDPQLRAPFRAVNNGEPVHRDSDQRYLYDHRYLLSPTVSPQRFTEAGLKEAIGESLDLLASPAGLFTKALLPRDPTGEVATLLGELDAGANIALRDGAWVSRDGRRAVLLLQTAAAGADTDAQARAVAAIRSAFARALAATGVGAGEAHSYRLLMTGPGVIAAQTRDTIKHEVERLSTLGAVLIVALLGFVYRSLPALVLGLVPVVSGALAGVAAVSLGFGVVHGLTLGFGTTLIGEAVDYAIYLFAQSAARADGEENPDPDSARRDWLAAFWPTVRLGVLTSICGFASLLLSGFPGLAQLGLYSIAGLASAALVTRFVLPHLMPANLRLRDLRPLGARLARLASVAPRLRWPLVALLMAACALLATHRGPLWSQELTSLSPVPAATQALDASLRADLGAPDVRYLVVITGDDRQSVLQGAERVAQQLQPLVQRGVIAGFESPARYLPSDASQRARQASLPPRDTLAPRLRAAVAELPVKPELFAPFLDDMERARSQPLLRAEDLRGTTMALAVDALLTRHGDHWSATLPLRAPDIIAATGAASASAAPGPRQSASLDTAPIRAALARSGLPAGRALFVDLKGESDRLYAGYLHEALRLSLGGLVAIVVLLAVALRSPRRVLSTLLPLAAAAVLVTSGLAASGRQLTLLHLVGLLLLVAVGSNYALFFNRAGPPDRQGPIAPGTLVSLLLANMTTVAAFGLLGVSSLPMLEAFGLTVGPGAVLALLCAAIFAPVAAAAATVDAPHGKSPENAP